MVRIRRSVIFLLLALALCLFGLRAGLSQSSTLRRVTNTAEEGLNLNPSLSGDGRRIAFESTKDLAGAGGTDLFRAIRADISTSTTSFIQLGAARSPAPGISQDGSRIAFAAKENPLGTNADGNSEIFYFDGSTLRQITNTSPGDPSSRARNGNFLPSLSDDGRYIAFASNRDLANLNADANFEIYIYDTTAQSVSQLTNTVGITGATDAKISGNGAQVAFIRDGSSAGSTTRSLMRQPRASGAASVIAANVGNLALTYGRAISDDGARVVYSGETATGNNQVFVFDGRLGNITRQITQLLTPASNTPEVPLHATISGDGTRLAFATRRNVNGGNTDRSIEVYTYDIPTGQFARVTDAPSQADGYIGANLVAEVVSSLNDDGTLVAFNFPRVMSGAVSDTDVANNSEIYVAGTAPRPQSGTLVVLNGASFGNEPSTTEAVAPDSIAVAQGGALANQTIQAQRQPDGTFPRNVGGTTVTVNGRPAQIFFVSPQQVNFLVPPETEIGTAEVVVTNSEAFQSRGQIAVLRAAPGVFTYSGDGRGEGVILEAMTLMPGPFDPTGGQLRLIIFSTGIRNASQLTITAGGVSLVNEGVMPSADMPGLDELHVRVPADLRGAGTVDLVVRADGRDSNPVQITFTGQARSDIVINEVLADPPDGLAGDANHDGVRDSSDDEFVELVNNSGHDIDISGFQLFTRSSTATNDTLRHTFAAGTIFPAGSAIVIFGGGSFNPSNPVFGGALVLSASSGGLSLTNSGGVVNLKESNGTLVQIFSYGGSSGLNGDANQSLTRSPDVTGGFTLHGGATGSGGRLFSPGTRVNGTPFITTPIARIEVSPTSATIVVGAQQQFTARAFDANNNEITGVIFAWTSSNPAVATINQNGLATGIGPGTTEIRASARGTQSAPATLTVNDVQRILTRIDVTPTTATIPVNGTQQFTARAFDQNNNEITGVTFTWASSNTNVATIDQTGLATGINTGTTFITASASSVTSNQATLNVVPPTFVINEVLADPPGSAATDLIGDANHDGTRSASDDEFIELVNATNAPLSLSGWTIRTRPTGSTTETTRHTFAANSTLAANAAAVIFGGGAFDPANPIFGCALALSASSGGLSLTNGGLTIIVRDSGGNLLAQFAYGTGTGLSGDNDQSLTRSPDITGSFVQHTTATNAGGRRFSPGVKVDGSPFGNCPGRLTSVTIAPASTSVAVGQTVQFTAQAFDQFGRAMTGINITFASSDTNIATVDGMTTDPMTGIATATVTGRNIGMAQITATATDGTTTVMSSPATLNVTAVPVMISRIDVAPTSATINRGQTQQFTATAFDQNNQPVSGVTFTWTSSSTAIATVNSSGLATGVGIGTATITATAPNGNGGTVSGQAMLTVQVPLVINEILADPPGSAATDLIGDANRDGVRDADDDEFVELVNTTNAPVDISGVIIADGTSNRFTFPANTTLAARRGIVIFGGGSPPANDPNFGGSLVLTTSTLSLNNGGDTVTVKLPVSGTDVVISTHTYAGEANSDQSVTRSPDADAFTIGGNFVQHTAGTNAAGRVFSPGERADGTPFASPPITRIQITPPAASIHVGETQSFTARAFSGITDPEIEIPNVSFIWDSSDPTKATVSPTTGVTTTATGIAAGTSTIRARAGGIAGTAPLAIDAVVASIELSPDTAAVTVGNSRSFTATARDSNGNVIPNITFTFSLRNPSPANAATIIGSTADSVTVRGDNPGSVTVVANYTRPSDSMVFEDTSLLTINPPAPDIVRVDVTPTSATINRGGTQQFTATAFDQNNQPVPGAVFVWSSFNVNVATVDQNGLATGVGIGTVTIVATTSNNSSAPISGQAMLTVQVPLVINEILADPPGSLTTDLIGDANRDGTRDSDDDEFVELVNNSNAPVNLSGVIIADGTSNRFTFPANTTLAAGRAVVIFGGGTPPANDPNFGGALVLTTSTLSLNNGGDTVTVKLPVNAVDVIIATQTYGAEGGNDQSLTRSPDLTGAFVQHTVAQNAVGRLFSPGERVDGTPFNSPAITRIEVTPAAASINVGQTQAFTARAFSNVGGPEVEITNISFIWDSSDPSKATVAPTIGVSTTATAIAAGTTNIRARAGGQSGASLLTITAIVASIDLQPNTAAVVTGNTQVFTAVARDASSNVIPNITFAFSLRNPSPANAATITATTADTVTVRGDNPGSVTVVANYTRPSDSMVFEDTSLLTINAPPPVISHVDVTPTSATINRGGTQQFTATAFDTNNQPVPTAVFAWTSSNTAVATVDNTGLATGVGIGTTTITATTDNGMGSTISGQAMLTVQVPLVINEILADPPGNVATDLIGDANRDDVRDSDDDEFIELLNNSNASVNLSGVIIADATSNRFTFPANTTLAAGRAVVIFGGGSPPVNDPAFGGALVLTTSTLSLNNGGDTVTVKLPVSAVDVVIATQTYGAEGGNDQSVTRSPDAEIGAGGGSFVQHSTAINAAGRVFSPGTRTDGTPFGSPAITRIDVTPATASINIGATQVFTARAFSNVGGPEVEVTNVSFIWDSSDPTKATVSPTTGMMTTATGVAAGGSTIRARAGGQAGTASLTVNALPTLSINDVSLTEGNSGTTTFSFTVSLSAPAPAGGVTFDIATQDNTATVADNDYVARSLTGQTIPAGQQTYTFDVTVNGDMAVESNESFFVNVTNVSSGASVGDGQGVGTIQNDDSSPLPTLSVNDVAMSEGNSGTTIFTFTVSLSAPAPTGGVTFDIATADGTAQDGTPVGEDNDYVARSLTGQTIAAGQQTFTFDVTVNGDLLVEPDETFFVNVTNVTNAIIADGQGQGTIQNNDAAQIVISQIYGGGGNTSAPFTNDFIEIFNRGTTTVSLSGWSVQYVAATGTGAWSVTNLSGTLQPGQYYLIQESSGGAIGNPLPTPDATGTITMAAGAGKVALLNTTTALNGACPSSANIMDLVGYGATANCFEGAGPAPAPSATASDLRAANGCTDANNNAADFSTGAPNPRNTSSPLNNCSAPPLPTLSINDVTAAEGNSGTTVFTFTVSLSAVAPAGGVTFNISTQDDTATVADNDYVARSLTGQTIAAGNQTYTFDVTVNGDVNVEPAETFFVNVTNVSGATITDGQGAGTVQNDDSAPVPALSVTDVSMNEGNTGTTTFTFTVNLSLPAPAGGVTFNIATADGTAQDGTPLGEDNDYVPRNLTAQTIPQGQQTYTFDVTVSGDRLVESNETFLVNVTSVTGATVSDGQGQGTIQNDDTALLVISQIYGGGNNAGATFQNDFVELFNRGTTTVNFAVTPYSVQYASAAGTFSAGNKIDLTTGTLAPGQYFLIKLAGGTTNGAALPTEDAANTAINMSATDGKVALVVGTTVLSGSGCPIGLTVADFVGYGTANCSEGTATGALNATRSARRTDSCVDTNANSVDFTVVTNPPAPRNSATTPSPCP